MPPHLPVETARPNIFVGVLSFFCRSHSPPESAVFRPPDRAGAALKPTHPIAVAILPVLALTEAFASTWRDLADELRVDLLQAGSVGELDLAVDGLPVILGVAGAESRAEDEVRAIRALGGKPLVVGVEADHRVAAALMRAGAADYFALPGDLAALRSTLFEAMESGARRARSGALADAFRASYDFGQIIGDSPAIRSTLQRASRIIPHAAASVLVTGETGTGKELLARAIHFNGPRAAAPFVEINCAALPAGLLESELFGYERGAFTDARNPKPGLFEAANGGTLFLDEIGHLPLDLQGKLLKSIEEKRIRRLGSVRTIDVEVRIIAATNVDLEEAVKERRFREDLYYRLTIIPLQLPPLRERGRDVLLLAEHFLARLAAQYELQAPALSEQVRTILLSHSWPGNVRELRNALERALLLGEGAIDPTDLFVQSSRGPTLGGKLPFPASLDAIIREAAIQTLKLHRGNKRAAAEALGISRSRLYRLLGDTGPEDSEKAEPPLT